MPGVIAVVVVGVIVVVVVGVIVVVISKTDGNPQRLTLTVG